MSVLERWPWLGDLHPLLPAPWTGVILVLTSAVCGLVVGAEREAKNKPAGLRTLTLISVGSCLFTITSILIGIGAKIADPGRVAAQVVTGVGFLGAGAIVRDRTGWITGLTTGASIWSTAAVGVLVGAGYAVAGLVMSVLTVVVLVGVRRLERLVGAPCRIRPCRISYRVEAGRTRIQILRILDRFSIPDSAWDVTRDADADTETLDLRYCHYHAEHRAVLFDLVEVPGLLAFETKRAPRDVTAQRVTDLTTKDI